jgi:hypothetical protein
MPPRTSIPDLDIDLDIVEETPPAKTVLVGAPQHTEPTEEKYGQFGVVSSQEALLSNGEFGLRITFTGDITAEVLRTKISPQELTVIVRHVAILADRQAKNRFATFFTQRFEAIRAPLLNVCKFLPTTETLDSQALDSQEPIVVPPEKYLEEHAMRKLRECGFDPVATQALLRRLEFEIGCIQESLFRHGVISVESKHMDLGSKNLPEIIAKRASAAKNAK